VSLNACDKLSQFLHENLLVEILTRVNDWLYHYRLLHGQLESMIFHMEGNCNYDKKMIGCVIVDAFMKN
jgi:hypothetical protein